MAGYLVIRALRKGEGDSMGNMIELVEFIDTTGIPLLVTVLVIYAVVRFVPEALEVWREERKDQKLYYTERQRQYDTQMQTVI